MTQPSWKPLASVKMWKSLGLVGTNPSRGSVEEMSPPSVIDAGPYKKRRSLALSLLVSTKYVTRKFNI